MTVGPPSAPRTARRASRCPCSDRCDPRRAGRAPSTTPGWPTGATWSCAPSAPSSTPRPTTWWGVRRRKRARTSVGLLGGEEEQRVGQVRHPIEGRQGEGRLVVGAGHQHRAGVAGRDREAVGGGGVQVGEEHRDIEASRRWRPTTVRDRARTAPGLASSSTGARPRPAPRRWRAGGGVARRRPGLRSGWTTRRWTMTPSISSVPAGRSPDQSTYEHSRGGQHLDVVTAGRQPLGQLAGGVLGAAADLAAVALHHEEEPERGSSEAEGTPRRRVRRRRRSMGGAAASGRGSDSVASDSAAASSAARGAGGHRRRADPSGSRAVAATRGATMGTRGRAAVAEERVEPDGVEGDDDRRPGRGAPRPARRSPG